MGQSTSKVDHQSTCSKDEGDHLKNGSGNGIDIQFETSAMKNTSQLDSMLKTMTDAPNLGTMIEIFRALDSTNWEMEGFIGSTISTHDIFKEILASVDTLNGLIEQSSMDNVHFILNIFIELLDATKAFATQSSALAKILHDDLRILLTNIDDSANNTNNKPFDKTQFTEAMCTLSQWLENDILDRTIHQWNDFGKGCQVQSLFLVSFLNFVCFAGFVLFRSHLATL